MHIYIYICLVFEIMYEVVVGMHSIFSLSLSLSLSLHSFVLFVEFATVVKRRFKVSRKDFLYFLKTHFLNKDGKRISDPRTGAKESSNIIIIIRHGYIVFLSMV